MKPRSQPLLSQPATVRIRQTLDETTPHATIRLLLRTASPASFYPSIRSFHCSSTVPSIVPGSLRLFPRVPYSAGILRRSARRIDVPPRPHTRVQVALSHLAAQETVETVCFRRSSKSRNILFWHLFASRFSLSLPPPRRLVVQSSSTTPPPPNLANCFCPHSRRAFIARVPPTLIGVLSVTDRITLRTSSPS